jgi:signal transduction histidine kinase
LTLTSRVLGTKGSLQRRYAYAVAGFAVLILAIILAFGNLIASSLSRRYMEDMLVSGRMEAERLADELSGEGVTDLHGVSRRREQVYRTLEGVAQRQVIESIEVFDADGKVVFTSEFMSTERVPDGSVPEFEIGPNLGDSGWQETENSFQIAVPVGEVGEIVLNLSKTELGQRVARLRRELLVQTAGVAGLTLVTLVCAFVMVWMLIQRTRRLESRHQEAKELALLGTLAANLAHEIRNPLNSINLNLELLEEDLEDAGVGEARHSLVGTRTEVSRLGKLVNDFLTYARPTDPVVDQVALDELVRECREFLAAEAAAAGVHLKVVSDSERVVCAGDPAQLKQVVLNLTLNAIQAVADHPPDRRVVALETRITGGDGVLTVRDRGDGIPVEHLTRVTEAFFTMKRGGTGLGLAIAKRFIAAQGGRLELENLETGGFESRIVLPRLEEGGKMAS